MMIDQETLPRTGKTENLMDGSERDGPASGVTIIEVITELVLRKKLVLLVTIGATTAGLILSLVLPVRYTSNTKIMPPQQTQSAASLMVNQFSSTTAGPLAAIVGGGLGLKNPSDLYVDLLNSRPVADAIIQRFKLSQVYRSRDMTAARKKLAANTRVSSEKSGLISISVTDLDRNRAAEMANAYTEELRNLTKAIATSEASQRRMFYEDQLRQAKDNLIAAEAVLQQVQQKKGLVALDAQTKAMIENLSILRARVVAKQVEIQTLRSYSTDRNPDLQVAERELSALQGAVAKSEQNGKNKTSSDLALKDISTAGLDYLRAEHDVIYRQALFDLLLKQYDAAHLDESKDAAIIQVAESAIPADRKSEPKRALIILFSLIGGMVFGCIAALLQWWTGILMLDPTINMHVKKLGKAIRGR